MDLSDILDDFKRLEQRIDGIEATRGSEFNSVGIRDLNELKKETTEALNRLGMAVSKRLDGLDQRVANPPAAKVSPAVLSAIAESTSEAIKGATDRVRREFADSDDKLKRSVVSAAEEAKAASLASAQITEAAIKSFCANFAKGY